MHESQWIALNMTLHCYHFLPLDPVLRALTMLDRDRRILQQADSALWDEALTSPTVTGKAPCFVILD